MTLEILVCICIACICGAWAWGWHEARVAIVQFHYLMALSRRCEKLAYATGVADGKSNSVDQNYFNDLCDLESEELRLANKAEKQP